MEKTLCLDAVMRFLENRKNTYEDKYSVKLQPTTRNKLPHSL